MMFSIRMANFWLLFLVFSSVCALAESALSGVEDLLATMEQNTQELNYQGSVVYTKGRHMESIKIHHGFEEGTQLERLEYLSGAPRVIIRRGDKVFFVNSKVGVIQLKKPLPPGPFARDYHAQLGLSNANYQLQLGGNTRVAGRSVQLIELQPQDRHRFGFELALDQKTGLLLRSLMIDQQGNVLERFEYTNIAIGGQISAKKFIITALNEPSLSSTTDAHLPQLKKGNSSLEGPQKAVPIWTVGWLPAGFLLLDAQLPHALDLKAPVPNAMMYTDGLTAFSIFVADGVDMSDFNLIQKGPTTAYSSAKKDSSGIYTVTVVGEIPAETAKEIAASVRR
tara:strand:+ start:279 stop:1292 length:1014 start_codon:yes stop_codon:yes gene_type:complete